MWCESLCRSFLGIKTYEEERQGDQKEKQSFDIWLQRAQWGLGSWQSEANLQLFDLQKNENFILKITSHYKEVLVAVNVTKTLFLTIEESSKLKLVYSNPTSYRNPM